MQGLAVEVGVGDLVGDLEDEGHAEEGLARVARGGAVVGAVRDRLVLAVEHAHLDDAVLGLLHLGPNRRPRHSHAGNVWTVLDVSCWLARASHVPQRLEGVGEYLL